MAVTRPAYLQAQSWRTGHQIAVADCDAEEFPRVHGFHSDDAAPRTPTAEVQQATRGWPPSPQRTPKLRKLTGPTAVPPMTSSVGAPRLVVPSLNWQFRRTERDKPRQAHAADRRPAPNPWWSQPLVPRDGRSSPPTVTTCWPKPSPQIGGMGIHGSQVCRSAGPMALRRRADRGIAAPTTTVLPTLPRAWLR